MRATGDDGRGMRIAEDGCDWVQVIAHVYSRKELAP